MFMLKEFPYWCNCFHKWKNESSDDVEKMKKMQEAMNKGINQAAAKLGGLPSISQQTQEAANNLFEEYYKSKE